MKISKILIITVLLNACGARMESGETAGSSLFSVDSTNSGQKISQEEGAQKLGEYCNDPTAYALKIGGQVTFQAGYNQHFDGSGSTYRLSKDTSAGGKDILVRSGEARMYSANGMGMSAPSVRMNHADFIEAECQVIEAANAGNSRYKVNSVASGSAYGGSLTEGSVAIDSCLSFTLTNDISNHVVAFCPNGFYQEAGVTSGADSRTQFVMQPL